jgi:hypothetical protein
VSHGTHRYPVGGETETGPKTDVSAGNACRYLRGGGVPSALAARVMSQAQAVQA